uniref:Uncharacterized protein n=1 Tax=Cyanothece sp. (strain PCC 7425 / ATCC 29141) TaxID=395961 RepID=B8HKV8_CYAP4
MRFLKTILLAFLLLVNLVMAQPAWADQSKFINSPDYQDVTAQIEALLQAQSNPDAKTNPAEVKQKLASLQTLKYIMETSEERATCSNESGKTLGVYLQAENAAADQAPTLYYLGDGETTDDDFSCTGVYLPSGTKVAFALSEPAIALKEPLALRIVEGTQLTVKTNPETGAVELNLPPAQILKSGEGNLEIPTLAQADIDALQPNAPED